MVNVFVPYRCPIKSAKSLDSKRLSRMCFESFEVLSSAIIKYNNPLLKKYRGKVYRAHAGHFNHPVVNWVMEDALHFEWVLRNAQELNNQYVLRYKKDDDCKPYKQLNSVMEKALIKLEPTKYKHNNLKKINFSEFFNYNQFKSQYNKKYEGDVVLHPDVSVQARYRLYLLHKWLYLDARNTSWSGVLPPVWAFNPLYREFLEKHFGNPINNPPELSLTGQYSILSLNNCHKNYPTISSLLNLGYKINKKFDNTIISINKTTASFSNTKIERCAIFNESEEYRYYLSCQWSNSEPLVALMLNPSTADAFKNDPTVQRIENLARTLNKGGFIVLNFSAYRATEPKDMIKQSDPFGKDNLGIIEYTLKQIINRWRVKPKLLLAYGNNIDKVKNGISQANKINKIGEKYADLCYLKMTKKGRPQHPLYISSDILPERYLPW